MIFQSCFIRLNEGNNVKDLRLLEQVREAGFQISHNVGIIRSFSRAERLKGVTPEKNLGVEKGATEWGGCVAIAE